MVHRAICLSYGDASRSYPIDADGSIWKGDLKTGEGEVVLDGIDSPALGLDYDKRTDYLYVAGLTAGA